MIREADGFLAAALALEPPGARVIQAAIHAAWCARESLEEPPPWGRVLALYDTLLAVRDDVVVRLNRAAVVAEVSGWRAALDAVAALDGAALAAFPPYHALTADLLAKAGRWEEARGAYECALALGPGPAERMWLSARRDALPRR